MSAGGSHELDLLLALQRMEAGGESDEHEKASKAIVNVNRLQSKVMEGDLLPPTVDDMGTGKGGVTGGVATGGGGVTGGGGATRRGRGYRKGRGCRRGLQEGEGLQERERL